MEEIYKSHAQKRRKLMGTVDTHTPTQHYETSSQLMQSFEPF